MLIVWIQVLVHNYFRKVQTPKQRAVTRSARSVRPLHLWACGAIVGLMSACNVSQPPTSSATSSNGSLPLLLEPIPAAQPPSTSTPDPVTTQAAQPLSSPAPSPAPSPVPSPTSPPTTPTPAASTTPAPTASVSPNTGDVTKPILIVDRVIQSPNTPLPVQVFKVSSLTTDQIQALNALHQRFTKVNAWAAPIAPGSATVYDNWAALCVGLDNQSGCPQSAANQLISYGKSWQFNPLVTVGGWVLYKP